MASFYSADNTALQQWFGQVDTDRSGQVNAKELQRALAQGGLNFSTKLVASMIRMYDADKTAQLSLAQFIELHKFLVNVQHVFATADRDRSGQLDLNECVPASNAALRRSRRAAPLPPRRAAPAAPRRSRRAAPAVQATHTASTHRRA
eukprot:scaffold54510_cov69-Phaeocystis_antarctica.AAC.4